MSQLSTSKQIPPRPTQGAPPQEGPSDLRCASRSLPVPRLWDTPLTLGPTAGALVSSSSPRLVTAGQGHRDTAPARICVEQRGSRTLGRQELRSGAAWAGCAPSPRGWVRVFLHFSFLQVRPRCGMSLLGPRPVSCRAPVPGAQRGRSEVRTGRQRWEIPNDL